MQLLWPWGLLALVPIAIAAVWALRRPVQRMVPVSSLRLWAQAVAAAGAAAKSSRRVNASWALLLAGSGAAGAALARPVLFRGEPVRRVAVAVVPSAELAGEPDALPAAAEALARRLDPRDQVRLILPTVLPPEPDWLNPAEAARRIADLPILPARAAELSLPADAADVQHTYRLASAAAPPRPREGVTDILLPARPGEVTLDAFAAEPVGGPAGEVARVFVAVRNHTPAARSVTVRLAAGPAPSGQPPAMILPLAPYGRTGRTVDAPAGEYLMAAIADASGPGARAALVRRDVAVHSVAIVGRDDPLVRRFVEVAGHLRLASPDEPADATIAIDADPPAAGPALAINPPHPPAGWRRAEPLTHLPLTRAARADHPVLDHVDFAGVAVRQVAGWLAGPGAPQQAIVTVDGAALVAVETDPRRVYVAFDIAGANTNFAATEGFVVFMSNVFADLFPAGRTRATFESLAPVAAASAAGWSPLKAPINEGAGAAGPLPSPGLHRDGDGVLHAVSLLGLRSADPPAPPGDQIAAAPRPPALPTQRPLPLAPILLLAAVACWLAGWALRLR